MFEIELAFFICPTFINILAKKNICRNHAKSKILKIFQTIMDKIFEKNHIFKLPTLPPIQCCPKERKFAGLIHTEVANTHKQHWKWGRGGFSQNILSTIVELISDFKLQLQIELQFGFELLVQVELLFDLELPLALETLTWSRITVRRRITNLISTGFTTLICYWIK